MIAALTDILKIKAENDADLKQQLVGGLLRTNDHLASLQSKLIDTIPLLADSTRPHGRRFVAPVGESCTGIKQFLESATPEITEADAEVIKSNAASEVDPMATFVVDKISEVNLNTGHCLLHINGVDRPVPGKITDPNLSVPNNVYTRALNEHAGCSIEAKAVRKNGVIQKLFVSDAK